jgi:hypothetical protein
VCPQLPNISASTNLYSYNAARARCSEALSCLVLSSTCKCGCKSSALGRAAVHLLPPTTLTMPWGCPHRALYSDPCCGPLCLPEFLYPDRSQIDSVLVFV